MADAAEKPKGRKPRGKHPEKRLAAPVLKKLGPGRHADGNGLYLLVDANGARRWVLRTLVRGRRVDIGLGGLAYVGLGEARAKAETLRAIAREGGDPLAAKRREKGVPTFAEAARKVHAEHIAATARNGKHVAQWLATLEAYAFPRIGAKAVDEVDQADVLAILAPIWTEVPETARRVRQRLRTVLDWARTAGRREGVNPVEGVEKGLPRQRAKVAQFAALPWRDVPDLWPRLEGVAGAGSLALRFAILTAARSGEVRLADWSEIDATARVWTIPAARMKAGREHRVPLSDAALALLAEAETLTGRRAGLVFPSRQRDKALSDMTLAAVLKRLEVAATPHGFRSSFRDWAEEAGAFAFEVKEAALAHVVKSKTERAYRRGDLFEQRRAMMAAWASFVTGAKAKVVALATAQART